MQNKRILKYMKGCTESDMGFKEKNIQRVLRKLGKEERKKNIIIGYNK